MDQEKLVLASLSAAADKHKNSSVASEFTLSKSFEALWPVSMEKQAADSMSVTSADQEKLLLLNKNTELRRVNKELMKLNDEWDQMYRNTTVELQHRLETLEVENTTLKDLNDKLLLKVDNQQSAKDYYGQALMLELKKNQELQDYVKVMEGRVPQPLLQKDTVGASVPDALSSSSPTSCVSRAPFSSEGQPQARATGCDCHREVLQLKEQLEAMRCQTEIYEAEFKMEHNVHNYTKQDNQRLRRKREEMRQKVDLMQEQLKVYEDDFQRERSDKQMLQRLLLKKTAAKGEPVLVHRCNNGSQTQGGDNWTHTASRKQHHPLCPKHPNRGQN
ncbi:uncharacterized protein LOC144081990 isoform X2 [Stigmatopora argus]